YYVDALIGAQTVNTLPRATLDAFRDHGVPKVRIGEGLEQSRKVVQGLKQLGIDLADISSKLEREGVKKFNEPFDALHAALDKKAQAAGKRAAEG
ncbi:MAG: transaldolase family protein, partial [Gammaproteobacteria bacterium]